MRDTAKLLAFVQAIVLAACFVQTEDLVFDGAEDEEWTKLEIAELQIGQLKGALGLFRWDVGRYPTTAEGLEALVRNPGIEKWEGPYLDRNTMPKDPWGYDYRYRCPGQDGEFDLFSLGAKMYAETEE